MDESSIQIDHLSQAWIDLQTSVSKTTETIQLSEQQAIEQENILNQYFLQEGSVSPDRLTYLAGLQISYIENLNRQISTVRDQRIKLAAQVDANEQRLIEHKLHKPLMDDDVTSESLFMRIQKLKNELNEQNQLYGKLKQQLDSDYRNHLQYDAIEKELTKATDDWNNRDCKILRFHSSSLVTQNDKGHSESINS